MNTLEPVPKAREQSKVVRDKDGLFKKRGIWQYRLRIDGRWRQFSTGTRSYRDAKMIRNKAVQAQEDGRLPTRDSTSKVAQIMAAWLEERKRLKTENTWKTETHLSKPILKAFGDRRLCDVSAQDLRAYQMRRSESVSNRTVNMELSLLRSLAKRHRVWSRISDDYKALSEPKQGPGRALTDEQERALFETAASQPAWEAAYYAALLAANTTARGCELKGLRLRDVDLESGTMRIVRSSTKTDAGSRVVPLNATAKWAIARLLERAEKLGAVDPEHHLFPACQRLQIDPTRPQKTWRTAWRSLTKAAGLKGLRFHDLRHHGITKLAEAGVPDQTLMAISGHVSREMLAHYSHVRQQAKREAVEAIDSFKPFEVDSGDVGTVVN